MVGDAAVTTIEQNMTADNIEAASKHATMENAETAYQGAVWADEKCDEYGIDKKEVATKIGSALWAGTKIAYKASADVDWN